MSNQFIEGLETRRCLSGGPGGGDPGGNGPGNGSNDTGIHLQDRQQRRDGSCQTPAGRATPTHDKLQLRKRDGSCTA